MRILVIVGECIQVNTSSNLCNLAYLRGLIETGHEVTLLSADGKGYRIDPHMVIPKEVRCYTYSCMTLYEKLSRMKKDADNATASIEKKNTPENTVPTGATGRSWLRKAKKTVLSLYGVHGIYSKFTYKAIRFRSDTDYDLVISLSTPASSHLLAYKLLNFGHVECKHWVQIWEDPWYSDISGFTKNAAIFNEEKRLVALAERVCYVSPITLENQKKLFPESAEKMFWAPLPSYYQDLPEEMIMPENKTVFGYFGEYSLPVRDLKPFYNAAKGNGIEVNVCGNSNLHLQSTDRIHFYPRLELAKLRPIEEKTSVLVFLCNRSGGQIPGKIYQYAATNKTILFILDGTAEEKRILKEFFEPFHRFVFCENNQEDIERAIQCIQKGELGNVVNTPLTQFSPANIVSQIIEESMREIT